MFRVKKVLLLFFLLLFLFTIRVNASEVNQLLDYINIKQTVSVENTIIPYKHVEEENSSLEVVSTIKSQPTWVQQVVELALSKVGCTYSQSRRESKDIFDCSSFVRRMYQEVTGVYIGSTTWDISDNLAAYTVSFDDLQPGDLLWHAGHIAMYIGDGKIVHAKGTAYGVVTDNISYGRTPFTKAFRPINYINDLIK